MFGLDNISFAGLDLVGGTLTVPVWAAGAAALALLLLLIVAIFRSGGLVRILVGVAAVGLAVVFLNRVVERDRADERRALDQRLNELTARVVAPGSILGCLEPGLGDAVESACEKVLFAGPETVGAAAALVAARWSLLADGLDYARKEPGYEAALDGLRRTLDADRFGFLAQMLAVREGCTTLKCDAVATLREPNRVRANLAERTFESLVARNVAAWSARARGGTPIAAAPAPPTPATGITFPSAASIPPVSIMNSEPAGSPTASTNAGAAPAPAPQTAPRRPLAAAPATAAAPRPRPSPAPVQLTPANNGSPPRQP